MFGGGAPHQFNTPSAWNDMELQACLRGLCCLPACSPACVCDCACMHSYEYIVHAWYTVLLILCAQLLSTYMIARAGLLLLLVQVSALLVHPSFICGRCAGLIHPSHSRHTPIMQATQCCLGWAPAFCHVREVLPAHSVPHHHTPRQHPQHQHAEWVQRHNRAQRR